ncbi:MAG: creatininase family protein [Acidobacteriota bacterium]
MKRRCFILLVVIAVPLIATAQTKSKGVLLENLTWVEAEKILKPERVVVIPLGAQAKEHGPHLKLKNDWLIAEYLKNRVLQNADVVIAPTVNYNFYPAFVEYPGSTSLRLETSRDLLIDICKSFVRFGVHRFYILNTGISTLRALKPAADLLAAEGILMTYTDLAKLTGEVEKRISKQEGGTHADEIETSMMLYIAPHTVEMKKAAKDFHPGKGRLTRDPNHKEATYSATGIWGDATLATREKGKVVVEALVAGILKDIEELSRSNLPVAPKQ